MARRIGERERREGLVHRAVSSNVAAMVAVASRGYQSVGASTDRFINSRAATMVTVMVRLRMLPNGHQQQVTEEDCTKPLRGCTGRRLPYALRMLCRT